MKINFATPVDFPEKYEINGHEIIYQNIMEIAQGGPLVGKLVIDSRQVGYNLLFGGPFLIEHDKLYAPLFIRKFCISGFKLCRINLNTLEYTLTKQIKDVIYLSHIDNGKVFFYENVNQENAPIQYMSL